MAFFKITLSAMPSLGHGYHMLILSLHQILTIRSFTREGRQFLGRNVGMGWENSWEEEGESQITPHLQLFCLNHRQFHQITLANSGVLVHIWYIRVDGPDIDGLPFLLSSNPTKIVSITSYIAMICSLSYAVSLELKGTIVNRCCSSKVVVLWVVLSS